MKSVTEKVKIVVETMDFKYEYETDIVSDGSFEGVNERVVAIVREAFRGFPLTYKGFSWKYI